MPGNVAMVRFRFLTGNPKAGVTSDPELSFDYHFSCPTKPVFVVPWDTGKVRRPVLLPHC